MNRSSRRSWTWKKTSDRTRYEHPFQIPFCIIALAAVARKAICPGVRAATPDGAAPTIRPATPDGTAPTIGAAATDRTASQDRADPQRRRCKRTGAYRHFEG